MIFSFYPQHEHNCPNVSHCPHLGGAALGTLVLLANEQELSRRAMHASLDAARARGDRLFEENQRLQKELDQVKLELKLERRHKFATNKQKQEFGGTADTPNASAADVPVTDKKKRGAPVGHPGWFRKTPTQYDWAVDVAAPKECPHCSGIVRVFEEPAPAEHLQEDIIEGRYRVVLYRHEAARCEACGKWVQKAGDGEILNSRIGPHLRSTAIYLRNVIGISYRKIPQAIEELFGITFTPAALIGFETMLADKAKPIVDDIAKKLGSSDDAVHADETYWPLNGDRAYYWVHCDARFCHFQFDTSRSGQVSRDVLGEHFTGTLVTDCYAGYEAHSAGAKQKCQAHLARTARDWQKLTTAGSKDFAFFEAIREFVQNGCRFHRLRKKGEFTKAQQTSEKIWLRKRLQKLITFSLTHEKALTLQKRILKHQHEWLVFLDDPRVPPTNNMAERALRPLVVLRKITFGHRSEAGAIRMARLMTVAETAKRHGHRPSDIYYRLFTQPPGRVLRRLYDDS